jgi:hypothetical protein
MTSSIESFDKAIISRQPNFDDRKTRSEFRKVIPNLRTVVVHCFDWKDSGRCRQGITRSDLSGRSLRVYGRGAAKRI